jgi:hypothetical protein
MGSSDSVGGRRICSSSWYLPSEQDTLEIFMLCHSYEPHHSFLSLPVMRRQLVILLLEDSLRWRE